VTATIALVLFAGGWLLARQMDRSLEALHEVEFDELSEMIGPSMTLTPQEVASRIHFDLEADAALYFIQVHNEDGTVIYRSRNLGETFLPDLAGKEAHWTATLPGNAVVRISEFRYGPWHLQIGSPLKPLRHVLRDYIRVSGLLLGIGALASVGLGFGFARLTLRPVRAIRETAGRIGGDNLSERIPVPEGRDELAALVTLLNQMFDRLEAAFGQVRGFSAVASHELKTPLSLIRLNAEKLRPSLAEDSDASGTLDDLLEEVSRLNRLIEGLLFLTKADSGALSIELKPIDTGTLLADFAEDARLLAEDAGVKFVLTRAEAGVQQLDPNLLRQLFLNLLSNALAVSPPGGTIAVESFAANGRWHLAMTDEGPGLPVDQHYRIFEPFVRYDHGEKTAPSSGTGLGLAICKSIAELHGGTIRARNHTPGTGLRVALSLPIQTLTDVSP